MTSAPAAPTVHPAGTPPLLRLRAFTRLEWGLLLLAALPIIGVITFVARYGYTVPWLDEYVNMVPLVLRQQAGTFTLGDLLVQYGDHRLPIPYGISVLFAVLSGGDMRWELAFSLLLMLVSFALLVDLYRHISSSRTETLIFAAIAAFLLFSLGQRQNWIWGNQKQMFLMMFGAYLSAWAMGRFPRSWHAVWICVAATIIAAWSFLGGNVLWVVIPIAMWLNGFRRPSMYAIWLVIATVNITLYVIGYARDTTYPVLWNTGLGAEDVRYFLTYLGHAFSGETIHFLQEFIEGRPTFDELIEGRPTFDVRMPMLMGTLGMVLLGIHLFAALHVRRVALRLLSPLLLLIGFTWANGLLLLLGRSDIQNALTAHYITLVVPFWIAIAALAVHNLADFMREKSLRRRWKSFISLSAVTACIVLFGFVTNTYRALVLRETFNDMMEQCFLTRLEASDLCRESHFFIWLDPAEVIVLLDQLDAHRLFLFRGAGGGEAGS